MPRARKCPSKASYESCAVSQSISESPRSLVTQCARSLIWLTIATAQASILAICPRSQARTPSNRPLARLHCINMATKVWCTSILTRKPCKVQSMAQSRPCETTTITSTPTEASKATSHPASPRSRALLRSLYLSRTELTKIIRMCKLNKLTSSRQASTGRSAWDSGAA